MAKSLKNVQFRIREPVENKMRFQHIFFENELSGLLEIALGMCCGGCLAKEM